MAQLFSSIHELTGALTWGPGGTVGWPLRRAKGPAAVNDGCRSDHWLVAWHPCTTRRFINDKHADQRGEGPDWGRCSLSARLARADRQAIQGVRELRQKL